MAGKCLPYGNCWVIVEDYMVSEMVIVNGWQCLAYDNCWVIVEDYLVSEMVIVNGWQCLP